MLVADTRRLEEQAGLVAGVLQGLANPNRLLVLCKLVENGEASVTTLVEASSLSQSALSQHLAKLRAEGLVVYRREGQTLWYRIADPRIEELLATLHRLFCADESKGKSA
jgi:DNA-binding transcriptional ArsR family regulator